MPIKKIAAFFVVLATTCMVTYSVTASGPVIKEALEKFIDPSVVSQVNKIDISKGSYKSQLANYTFLIPSEWKNNVIAEREASGIDGVHEKINFSCISSSELYKPKLLVSLLVFDKSKRSKQSGYTTVLESKDYIFAYKLGNSAAYTLAIDQELFERCYKVVNSSSLLKKFISLPQEQRDTISSAIFVNGEAVKSKVEIVDKVYYLPLREICESMGYSVYWVQRDSAIEVVGSDFYDRFKMSDSKSHDTRGIKMMIINDRTYVSTAYFLKIMGKSVDIDERRNVYIFSE